MPKRNRQWIWYVVIFFSLICFTSPTYYRNELTNVMYISLLRVLYFIFIHFPIFLFHKPFVNTHNFLPSCIPLEEPNLILCCIHLRYQPKNYLMPPQDELLFKAIYKENMQWTSIHFLLSKHLTCWFVW